MACFSSARSIPITEPPRGSIPRSRSRRAFRRRSPRVIPLLPLPTRTSSLAAFGTPSPYYRTRRTSPASTAPQNRAPPGRCPITTPRIPNRDRSALRKALARWEMIDEPTWVVLPLEPWWLRAGLSCLTEEVRAAARPVAIVLLHRYNAFDAAGAIAGLLTFMSAVDELPVVLLRCDISAIGAVAHAAFAGFVGLSATTRHGPMPMKRTERAGGDNDEPDESPAVFVPAL